jgi:hypothetical protein
VAPLNDDIKAQVIVGDEAEEFVSSELGRTVLEMAKQDAQLALEAFCDADLADSAKIAKIQQDARIASRFNQYLVELITRGREALAAHQ